MGDEEEVVAEVEAAESVYGDDCHVIETYPPHLHVHLKPRTADISSQQFVEALIGIKAGPKYPEEPPDILIIDSKGLDERRQKILVASIRDKALELTSCLMLVSLCEEAVEKISSMNHPDGDCPLCLYPLLDEDDKSNSKPFMKLMSCFHCFHCECIIRWWSWNQVQAGEETSGKNSRDQKDMRKMMEESTGMCPVCRKVFLAKDIEHVLDLVEIGGNSDSNGTEVQDSNVTAIDTELLQSDSERSRRERFESILKLQQENSGLIEPKKHEVLLPGMFIPQPVVTPSTESQRKEDTPAKSETSSSSSTSTRRPGYRRHGNSNVRRQSTQNPGKQDRHWTRKDNRSENSNKETKI